MTTPGILNLNATVLRETALALQQFAQGLTHDELKQRVQDGQIAGGGLVFKNDQGQLIPLTPNASLGLQFLAANEPVFLALVNLNHDLNTGTADDLLRLTPQDMQVMLAETQRWPFSSDLRGLVTMGSRNFAQLISSPQMPNLNAFDAQNPNSPYAQLLAKFQDAGTTRPNQLAFDLQTSIQAIIEQSKAQAQGAILSKLQEGVAWEDPQGREGFVYDASGFWSPVVQPDGSVNPTQTQPGPRIGVNEQGNALYYPQQGVMEITTPTRVIQSFKTGPNTVTITTDRATGQIISRRAFDAQGRRLPDPPQQAAVNLLQQPALPVPRQSISAQQGAPPELVEPAAALLAAKSLLDLAKTVIVQAEKAAANGQSNLLQESQIIGSAYLAAAQEQLSLVNPQDNLLPADVETLKQQTAQLSQQADEVAQQLEALAAASPAGAAPSAQSPANTLPPTPGFGAGANTPLAMPPANTLAQTALTSGLGAAFLGGSAGVLAALAPYLPFAVPAMVVAPWFIPAAAAVGAVGGLLWTAFRR
jgi:hypothetical protein